MPMIDVYAATGTFSNKHDLAQQLAAAGHALGAGAAHRAVQEQHGRLHP